MQYSSVFFFFFSSRRRHTRCLSDWSSDVCSSDLEKTFFVFADTVAARSFKQRSESHGWLGVRFQSEPRGQPSQIIIHVRLLDATNVEQQEALGVIGVNLLYGAFYLRQPEKLISSLQENLPLGRIEVDMIKFSGPIFQSVDNRLMSLQLVSQ